MVRVQEDGCIYSYGTVRFTYISISSLVGRTVCTKVEKVEKCVLPTRLLILRMYKIPYHTCTRMYNRLPEDDPSVSKHVADIKIKILI